MIEIKKIVMQMWQINYRVCTCMRSSSSRFSHFHLLQLEATEFIPEPRILQKSYDICGALGLMLSPRGAADLHNYIKGFER